MFLPFDLSFFDKNTIVFLISFISLLFFFEPWKKMTLLAFRALVSVLKKPYVPLMWLAFYTER